MKEKKHIQQNYCFHKIKYTYKIKRNISNKLIKFLKNMSKDTIRNTLNDDVTVIIKHDIAAYVIE